MNNTTERFERGYTECLSVFRFIDSEITRPLLTGIYASLIPLIIGANVLLITGITKIKQNKFSSSQILFLTLFLSDLSFGVVRIPCQIYLMWRSDDPSCLEIQLGIFSTTFRISMSGNVLFMITIDSYISAVHKNYHKRIVTNKSLGITIIFMTLISFTWAASTAVFPRDFVLFFLTAGEGAVVIFCISCNIALLINVRIKTKNSSVKQTALNTKLTQTIILIIAILVITYAPLFVALNIFKDAVANSTELDYILKVGNISFWTMIPSQANAVFNSVIYLARKNRMKHYFYKLFNCQNVEKHLRRKVSPFPNATLNNRNQWQLPCSYTLKRRRVFTM